MPTLKTSTTSAAMMNGRMGVLTDMVASMIAVASLREMVKALGLTKRFACSMARPWREGS